MLQLGEQIHYLQIETGTVCNYKCVYCPVAYHPRKGGFLPLELVEKIVRDLDYFPNLKQIYLNGYDEPTLNPQLATIVGMLAHLPAKITLLTNGTRLTPQLAEDLARTGANIEFDIHLAAVNQDDFQRVHQSKLFGTVMKNIEYLKTFEHLGRIDVHISMQGRENQRDNEIFEEIQAYFVGIHFKIHKWFPNDRAGLLKNEFHLKVYNKELKGCSLDNRTNEWLHINANGKAIMCCQDYFEQHVIGDIYHQNLAEIVAAEKRQQYHEWTTGKLEAPGDYICRSCLFAAPQE